MVVQALGIKVEKLKLKLNYMSVAYENTLLLA